MSGPRHELLERGTLGPLGVRLLYQTVARVVRLRNLPPPPGTDRWTADAIQEAAHDVFAARSGPVRLLELAVKSTDEDGFRSRLWTLVVNDLISAGRRTERGRLSERIKGVLPHVPGLVTDAEGDGNGEAAAAHGSSARPVRRLVLQSAEVSAPEPRFEELVSAAAGVAITVPAWDPASPRRAPLADRDSLVAMVTAVLSRAPAGLPLPVLVDAIAARLGVHDMPDGVEMDVLDALAPPSGEDPAAAAASADGAARLLRALSPNQQLVLPYLDEPARVIAEHSGLGRTKAWQTANETRLLLAELLAGDADPASTLAAASATVRARWNLR